MGSTAVAAALAAVASMPEQRDKLAKYQEILAGLNGGKEEDLEDLKAVFELIMSDSTPQVVSRQASLSFAELICPYIADSDGYRDLAAGCVDRIKAHVIALDEADYLMRKTLFERLSSDQEYTEAANVLAGLNMDGSGRNFSDAEKADVYVKVAEAFLADEEPDSAENYVNKASPFMHQVDDIVLQLRYRTTAARVLDANRKFLDAAMRFYDLSQTQHKGVSSEERLELLEKAITCAILGKAGPQRSRILGTLYKDERLHSLDNSLTGSTHSAVLTKMYTQQILRKSEMMIFQNGLMPHQQAVSGDGLTILERAVIEHNVLAASRIYDNIRFEELGRLLDIQMDKSEKVAARMVSEGRLKASIDQVDGLLIFKGDMDELQQWDDRISGLCNRVNMAVETIAHKHPHVVEAATEQQEKGDAASAASSMHQ